MTFAAPPARPNPFAGIPISDYVRDAAAIILLLLSLTRPWNAQGIAGAHVHVVLITILSVLSVSITYLARAGVLPPTVTVERVWQLRLAANAPYLLLVAVYVIIDLVAASGAVPGGVGTAAVLGVAGALLAAQPRQAEVAMLQPGAPVGELWMRFVTGFFVAAVGLTALNIVFSLVAILGGLSSLNSLTGGMFGGYMGAASAIAVIVVLIIVLFNGVAFVWLYRGILRRDEGMRVAALVVGVGVVGSVVVEVFTGVGMFSVDGLDSITRAGYGLYLFGALAGLAAAPSVRIAMAPMDPVAASTRGASNLFLASAALAGYSGVIGLALLITVAATGLMSYLPGGLIAAFVGVVVIMGALVAAGMFARSRLRTPTPQSRPIVLAILAGEIVVGIIYFIIAAQLVQTFGAGFGGRSSSFSDIVLFVALPLGIAYLLTVPAAVRAYFGPILPAGVAAPGSTSYTGQVTGVVATVPAATAAPAASVAPPVAPPAPPAAPTYSAEVAADPATSAAVLFEIAQSQPELRKYIAANPSTYPDLVAWLGKLGDPEIDAALAQR